MESVTAALACTAEQEQITAELLLKVVTVISDVGRGRVASGNRALTKIDTAISHDLTIATLNIKGFEGFGASLLNPWNG